MNTNSNNSKNSMNLGIVVECAENADENQALLHISHNDAKSKSLPIEASSKVISEEKSLILSKSEQQHNLGMSSIEIIDNESGTTKVAKKRQPQSRVQRSRLNVITFLNNITAPATHSEPTNTKNFRSQSISTPLNCVIRQQEKKNKTTNKQNTSNWHSVKEQRTLASTIEHQEVFSISEILPSDGINETENEPNFYPAPTDKLSIRSEVSMAASINSGPTESLFSGTSGHSLSGVKPKQRECPICCVRQSMMNFQRLKSCTHLACKTCLIKYLNTEIMESRTNISCPECPVQLHASDIYQILSQQRELLERFEFFSLRRALSTDPDTRWCPAPDCIYAVIAQSCAACPQLKCGRCETMFCYHCKNYWHSNQTCDQARAKLFFNERVEHTGRPSIIDTEQHDVMKACPRCGALIVKMNDGSCNHMQCAICNTEFCWLCLKQINELHYLSPTGCTFWGKKPWTRKKKLLWQIGTLIGAPLGIALIAGLAVPGIICGVPIFVGRKTYQRFSNLSRTKRQIVTALSVFGSLIISPVLAVMTVGVGVPIMLAYVYGVVPLSLCRNGACGGSNSSEETNGDDEVAYGEEVLVAENMNTTRLYHHEEKIKSFSHNRKQSIVSSGLISLTDKPNTEDASIQAIAGSHYNYDNRSVHTVLSNGQSAAIMSAMEATSYNNEDAENASTLACCSASIVAQAERRSLTDSSGSFKTRPRSSISNSRGTSEEPGRIPGKLIQKSLLNNPQNSEKTHTSKVVDNLPGTSRLYSSQTLNISTEVTQKNKSRFSIRLILRHPINTLLGKKKGVVLDGNA